MQAFFSLGKAFPSGVPDFATLNPGYDLVDLARAPAGAFFFDLL
jgi:hypothetical protein